jgi:hypothetical protein
MAATSHRIRHMLVVTTSVSMPVRVDLEQLTTPFGSRKVMSITETLLFGS